MTVVYCEFYKHINGSIKLEKDLLFSDRTPENPNGFYFIIRSGNMEGKFLISKDELKQLKKFLKDQLKENKES